MISPVSLRRTWRVQCEQKYRQSHCGKDYGKYAKLNDTRIFLLNLSQLDFLNQQTVCFFISQFRSPCISSIYFLFIWHYISIFGVHLILSPEASSHCLSLHYPSLFTLLYSVHPLFKCHSTQEAPARNYGASPPPPCHFLNEFMVLWPRLLHSGEHRVSPHQTSCMFKYRRKEDR